MPKTAAERMRECRERKRARARALFKNSSIPKNSSQCQCKSRKNYELEFEDDESYGNFNMNRIANRENKKQSVTAGSVECSICDQMFLKYEVKSLDNEQKHTLWKVLPGITVIDMKACKSCKEFLIRYNAKPCECKSRKNNELDLEHNASYGNFNMNRTAHREYKKHSITTAFDFECSICDQMFLKYEVKPLDSEQKQTLWKAIPGIIVTNMQACHSCKEFLIRYNSTKTKPNLLWRYMLQKILLFPKTFIN